MREAAPADTQISEVRKATPADTQIKTSDKDMAEKLSEEQVAELKQVSNKLTNKRVFQKSACY